MSSNPSSDSAYICHQQLSQARRNLKDKQDRLVLGLRTSSCDDKTNRAASAIFNNCRMRSCVVTRLVKLVFHEKLHALNHAPSPSKMFFVQRQIADDRVHVRLVYGCPQLGVEGSHRGRQRCALQYQTHKHPTQGPDACHMCWRTTNI